jgi:hypothetical protein
LVEEKLIDGKLSLEFSTEGIKLIINSDAITVNTQDDYYIRSFTRKDEIINNIRTLRYEVEKSSNTNKEKKKTSFLLQRMEYILASTSYSDGNSKFSKLKGLIIHTKWTFTITSPFIMKIIELIEYMLRYSQ